MVRLFGRLIVAYCSVMCKYYDLRIKRLDKKINS